MTFQVYQNKIKTNVELHKICKQNLIDFKDLKSLYNIDHMTKRKYLNVLSYVEFGIEVVTPK